MEKFSENDFVWHEKNGVGRVALADGDGVLVEFDGGGEELFESGTKAGPPLKVLSPEGYLLRLRNEPDAIRELAASDPAAILTALHEDFGATLDTARLKKVVAGSAVTDDEWEDWLKKAQAAAKADPRFSLDKNGSITFLGDMAELASSILVDFKRSTNMKEKQRICKEILRLESQGVPVDDAKEAAVTFFTGTAASTTNTLGARLEALLFLKGLDEIQHDMIKQELYDRISSLDVYAAAEALAQTADNSVRLQMLEIFEDLLADKFIDIAAMLTKRFKKQQRDWILDTLIAHKTSAHVKELLDAALADMHTNQQPFIWMGKRMFEAPKQLIDLGYSAETVVRRFFKLLLEIHITSAFSSNPKDGPSVSREEDEILKFLLKKPAVVKCLAAHDQSIVSVFGSLYMDNSAITDEDRAEMLELLKKKFPAVEFTASAPKEDGNELILTRETFDKYEEELADIIDNKLPENTLAIKTAREWGDLSENAEYHAAKERQSLLTSRKRQLEHILETAKVLE